MKKWLALVLAVILVLCACTASAQTYTLDEFFTIEYPDGWGLNPDSGKPEDVYEYCGFFYGPGDTDLNFRAAIYQEEDMADFRLFDYEIEDAEFAEYAETLIGWFGSRNLTYVGAIYSNQDNIPFIVLQGYDEYGPLMVVDTMANGWEFFFEFYAYADSTFETCRELTDEDLLTIRQIIGSFKPAE